MKLVRETLRRLIFIGLLCLPAAALAGSMTLLGVGNTVDTGAVTSLKQPVFSTFRFASAGATWYGAGPGTAIGNEQNSLIATSATSRCADPICGDDFEMALESDDHADRRGYGYGKQDCHQYRR